MNEAVAEPTEIHAEPPMTNIGDVYKAALAKENGEPEAAPEPAKAPVDAPEPETKAEEPAKPQSALEAALAEQPAEEKKPDVAEEFPEQLPNEGRKDHWAKARARMAADHAALLEREKAINDLKSQLGQAKENPESKAALERIQAENAELRDAITAANVELLPEFRQKYIEGRNQLIAKAADKVKAYGGSAEAFKEALSIPEGLRRDAAIEEAMGNQVNDMSRSKVNAIVAQLDDLNEQAQAERANSQQSYERLTQKQQATLAAQQQENEARKIQTFASVTKQLQSEVPTLRPVDASVPGAEEWNAGIQKALEDSQKLFSADATEEETVATAIKGSDYDRVTGLLATAWKENAQLKKELAAQSGAQPDVRSGKPPAKSGKDAALEKTAGQIYAETMAALSSHDD